MEFLKNLLIGRRTYLMAAVAAILHYLVTLGIVTDPFLLDSLIYARDAAFLAIPVFIRLGIKAVIKE